MNCTTGAKQMINQRRISKKSLRTGFTPVFAKQVSDIAVWDKTLGHYTVRGHAQIGWVCNTTGKRISMGK